MSDAVAIVGLGIHKFGRSPLSGLQQAAVASRHALEDAGVSWSDIEFAVGGSTDAGNADTLVNELGLTGLPFMNVANGCATGGSALASACDKIAAGSADIGLVLGFDKHPRGAFAVDPAEWGLGQWYGEIGMALTTQFFAMKIQRYMHDYGISDASLVRVAEKAYRHAALNPNAWRREALSADEIGNSAMVNDPLRKYMFCSPAEGAVALIVCKAEHAARYSRCPIYISACEMRTRKFGTFEVFSPAKALYDEHSATHYAAQSAFEKAGIGPADIDIAQLQDTESGAEIIHMAENGFCEHGEQEQWLRDGVTTINGRFPVNTDGGCIGNGEPIGASGLRQVHEICMQLRGTAGERQVPKKLRTGYTQVYGAPGVAGVTILRR
jgi:acetyl-CoA acetyltransferase